MGRSNGICSQGGGEKAGRQNRGCREEEQGFEKKKEEWYVQPEEGIQAGRRGRDLRKGKRQW